MSQFYKGLLLLVSVCGVVSMTLKVLGIVDWSWWATLLPFWIVPAAFLWAVVLGVCVIGTMELGKKTGLR